MNMWKYRKIDTTSNSISNVQLIPREDIMADVKADYKAMENMIYGTVPSFDAIIEYLYKLEKEIHSLV